MDEDYYHCGLCCCDCMNWRGFQQHCNGNRHRKKMHGTQYCYDERGLVAPLKKGQDVALTSLCTMLNDHCTRNDLERFYSQHGVQELAPERATLAFRTTNSNKQFFRIDWYEEAIFQNSLLPLHFACQNGCSLPVICFLLKAFPESIRIPTAKGELPLHCACGVYNKNTHHKLEVIEYLLRLYPQAVRQTAKKGCLPLHHAVQSGADLAILKLLVEADPNTLFATRTGGRLSMDRAGRPLELANRLAPTIPCPHDAKIYLKVMTTIHETDLASIYSVLKTDLIKFLEMLTSLSSQLV